MSETLVVVALNLNQALRLVPKGSSFKKGKIKSDEVEGLITRTLRESMNVVFIEWALGTFECWESLKLRIKPARTIVEVFLEPSETLGLEIISKPELIIVFSPKQTDVYGVKIE